MQEGVSKLKKSESPEVQKFSHMLKHQIGITKVMEIWYYFANDCTSGLLDF